MFAARSPASAGGEILPFEVVALSAFVVVVIDVSRLVVPNSIDGNTIQDAGTIWASCANGWAVQSRVLRS